MQVSADIIRFPSPATLVTRQEEKSREPDNVLAFPEQVAPPMFSAESQEHGQVFAAHRILTRIADQLDAMEAL